MAFTTYDELKTEVAEFLNRDDLTDSIPSFVTLAEAQINRDVRHWKMEARSDLSLSDRYTDLPDDFLEPVRLYVTGNNRSLNAITPDEMQDIRARNADSGDEACYYAITAGQIEIEPTQSSGTLELYYVQSVPALSDSNTSNWLLTRAPDVYLYGTLAQSAPFLHDDGRLIVWTTLYTNAVNALNLSSEMGKFGGQNLKMRVAYG